MGDERRTYWRVTYTSRDREPERLFFYASTQADASMQQARAAAVEHIEINRGGGRDVVVELVEPPREDGPYRLAVPLSADGRPVPGTLGPIQTTRPGARRR